MKQAIRDAKGSGPDVELIVENAGYFKTVKIDYHDGERYPHLTREANTPDLLEQILKPMAKHPAKTNEAE